MSNAISKAGSLAAFALAVIGILLLIGMKKIFAVNILGIAVQVAAALLMIWARITFGIRSFHATANTTSGGLVTKGPYAIFRHPIYSAIIYFVWAGVLSMSDVPSILAALLVTLSLVARMLFEERFLLTTYGDEYREYSKKTKRLIPLVF